MDPAHYKSALATLHTETVTEVINSTTPNRVLGRPPPQISPSERDLPRLPVEVRLLR